MHSGLIRIRVLGEAKDLPTDLQAIAEATGPDDYIEGSVLVDLCMHRSGQRGNGCDAPNVSEELPTPMASPPRPPTPPAAQVRQYSWHHYAKKKGDLYDIRREFVGPNKQTIRVTPSLSQQAPLVSKAHLMAVVRRVERSERSKGKHLRDSVFKGLHQSCGKNITSLLPSRQKSERVSQQYSVIRDNAKRSNSEMNQLVHASQYADDKYTLKPSKARKEKGEVKFKRPESTNCDVIKLDSDVIIRDVEVNKPVARKRYAPKKHSFVHTKEFLKSTLSMCSQTFTEVALMLAVVISVVRSGLNIKLPRRICTSGLASVGCQECESDNNSNSAHPLSLAILRESAAAIIDISKGLCSCIRKGMFLNDSKQLTRSMKILQNTIRRGVTIFSNHSSSSMLASPRAPYRYHDYSTRSPTTFAKNVLSGKHLDVYIFPSADFCASRVDYLDTYTVNLESDYNITVFYNLRNIYIYIYFLPFVVVL